YLILTVGWSEAFTLAAPKKRDFPTAAAGRGNRRMRRNASAASLDPSTPTWRPVVALERVRGSEAMACAVSAQMRSGSNGKGPLCSLWRPGRRLPPRIGPGFDAHEPPRCRLHDPAAP